MRIAERENNMTTQQKESKNKILKTIKESVEGIFDASASAKPFEYRSGTGIKYTQDPGNYSSPMTKAMASDAMRLSLFMCSKNEQLADILKKVSNDIREMDITLMRMYDDKKAHRPVIDFPYKKIKKTINRLTEIKRSEVIEEELCSRCIDLMDYWVNQVSFMSIFAYCIQCHDKISNLLIKAEQNAYDEDGNLVYGISKDDEKCAKILIAMEQILLKALVRIPFNSELSSECMDKIEVLNCLTEAVINGDLPENIA